MYKLIVSAIFLTISLSAFGDLPSIGVTQAQSYEVVERGVHELHGEKYISACAVSSARSKEKRAQTMVKAVLDVSNDAPERKVELFLAPHKDLCLEGRLIGTTYYSPDGQGWKAITSNRWTWYIMTTGVEVTPKQISDTLIYESRRDEFKTKYGVWNYSEKLDEFVKEKLGREPEYVTSGVWVDTYLVE